jgi:chaperone BCS1
MLNLPIFVFSLSDDELNDNQLADLFASIPTRSVLLLEDVDSAGLRRESMAGTADGKKPGKKGITLSGLLNCLDGPASVEGRLLCMTSNSPDSLDSALVRPGRCDLKVLFGYTCPEVSAQMFMNIYTKTPAELYAGETDYAAAHNLHELAASFASKIPANASITPAECQAWLLANRTDPLAAMNGAAAWATEVVGNKLRGANVAEFSNEIDKSTKASPTEPSTIKPSIATLSTTESPTTRPSTIEPSSIVAPPITLSRATAHPTPPPSEEPSKNDDATLSGANDDDSSNNGDPNDCDGSDYEAIRDAEFNACQTSREFHELMLKYRR